MKSIKKFLIVFISLVIIAFVIFIGFGAYLSFKSNDCDNGFSTDFLGKEISFPISLKQAEEKYDLKSNGIIGYSISEKDTLLVVDTHQLSKKGILSFVFYLRDLSLRNIEELKKNLELKYKQKFIKKKHYSDCEYIKINDCTFLVIYTGQFKTKEFGDFINKKIFPISDSKITCRISFFHDISENHLPGLSGMSGESIGTYPYYFGLTH